MWRGRGGRRSADPYATLLLIQLGQQIAQLENKPPVTLSAIAACFLAYYSELLPPPLQPPPLQQACLQPFAIVKSRQWGRLIWSALLHADEVHLCYNMASFLYKGANLEPRMGSAKFAALLFELLLLSHGLVVLVSGLASSYVPEYQHLWYDSCAVGFSAVIFGLKVVLNYNSPGYSSVLGFTLPTKYLAWAELFIASALNPRASFLGHLCGIFAGLLHVKYIAPAVAALQRTLQRTLRQHRLAAAAAAQRRGGSSRTAAAAARPQPPPAAAAGGSSSSTAAAAAQQRMQAQQQRGLPSRRGHQQQGQYASSNSPGTADGGADGSGVDGSSEGSSSRQLSAEELRLRRLQRFDR